nr:E3 ubiquitin-protein ligase DTX1-like [Macaca fascicularis]
MERRTPEKLGGIRGGKEGVKREGRLSRGGGAGAGAGGVTELRPPLPALHSAAPGPPPPPPPLPPLSPPPGVDGCSQNRSSNRAADSLLFLAAVIWAAAPFPFPGTSAGTSAGACSPESPPALEGRQGVRPPGHSRGGTTLAQTFPAGKTIHWVSGLGPLGPQTSWVQGKIKIYSSLGMHCFCWFGIFLFLTPLTVLSSNNNDTSCN